MPRALGVMIHCLQRATLQASRYLNYMYMSMDSMSMTMSMSMVAWTWTCCTRTWSMLLGFVLRFLRSTNLLLAVAQRTPFRGPHSWLLPAKSSAAAAIRWRLPAQPPLLGSRTRKAAACAGCKERAACEKRLANGSCPGQTGPDEHHRMGTSHSR